MAVMNQGRIFNRFQSAAMAVLLLLLSFHAGHARAAKAQDLQFLREMSELSKRSTLDLYKDSEKAFFRMQLDSAMNMLSIICSRYSASEPEDMQRLYVGAFDRYGSILFKRGAYAHAMDNLLRGRFIAEKYKFRDLQRRVYANIGNVFAASGNYRDATKFFSRALALTTLEEDSVLYPNLLNNLFTACYLKGDFSEAARYASRYNADCRRYPRYEFDTNLSHGMFSLHKGDPRSAIESFRKALAEAKKRNYMLCVVTAYTNLKSAFEKTGRMDSALYYGRLAANLAYEVSNDRLAVETLHELSDLFAKAGMTDSALEYKRRYLVLADSISYLEDINKMENSLLIYELDASSAVIKNLSDDNSMQWKLLLASLAVILVFVALVVRLVMQNKKIKKTYTVLYENNAKQLSEQSRYEKRIKQLEHEVEECRSGLPADVADDRTARKMVDDDMRKKIVADVLKVFETTTDFCSCNYSLEQLASDIGFNPRYVSEVINQDLGKNFRTILNEYRIRVAMQYLGDYENYGHLTLKAISESVGYKSQSTFISVFTKITGLKPNIYQKLAIEHGAKK